MKKVEAIIRHFKMEEVALALIPLGISGLTVIEGRGTAAASSRLTTLADAAEFLPKIKLEVVVPDEILSAVVETIQRVARTGNLGDGKILITSIEQSIHIRTGGAFDGVLKASA